MDEQKQTRIRRTVEERIADIQKKVDAEHARHNAMIAKLNAQIDELKKPRLTKKEKAKRILQAAEKQFTPEELAEKLGLDFETIIGN